MPVREVNFDGLVGPTHHYGGLSVGNIASQRHRHQTSSPRRAALEGLAKMRLMADLGLAQAVLPPHDRPDIAALRRLGFDGPEGRVLDRAHREAPHLLAACASASAMWTANAATVSPGPDTADGRVHFTPANLVSQFHRSLEPPTTAAALRAIFPDQSRFAHHAALPAAGRLGDEGAANHTRPCPEHGAMGVELFVYGRSEEADARGPRRFPARQSLDASRAVARLHGLSAPRCVFIRQNPDAIDAGAFHNDVVAVGNQNVLLHHERAFADTPAAIDELRRTYAACCGDDLIPLCVADADLPLAQAIDTYLFNSQLVTLPSGAGMALVCPVECREHDAARSWLEAMAADQANPISRVLYADVRQSMRNGGGPACLRLRVALDDAQREASLRGVYLDDNLYAALLRWIDRHYRDELTPRDLADPHLLHGSRTALDELTAILGLGPIYPFQLA